MTIFYEINLIMEYFIKNNLNDLYINIKISKNFIRIYKILRNNYIILKL